MSQVLKMPMMGNTMEIGVVVEWLASEGETVSAEEPVVIVESEKASNEVVAEQDGILTSVEVNEGEEVPPGTRLGVIRGSDENIPTTEETAAETTTETSPEADREQQTVGSEADAVVNEASNGETRIRAAPGARKCARKASVPLEQVDGSGPGGAVLIADLESHLDGEADTATEAEELPEQYIPAPPRVRRLARKMGVNLAELTASAQRGRITERDVRRTAEDGDVVGDTPAERPVASQPLTDQREGINPATHGLTVVEQRQFSGMRETIARRMHQSATKKPHVTLNRQIDAEPALAVVSEYQGSRVELGLTDILVYAAVEALDAHPEFNAWYMDGTLALIEEINIGVAVDIDDGLVTPVLEEAARKPPVELAEQRADLTAAVQEGRYSPDDITGGTFTISNLGMFSVDSFDPIINPPEIAILGVGRVRDGSDEHELTLSLSFDHRVADGANAARFLDTLVDAFTLPTHLIARRTQIALE